MDDLHQRAEKVKNAWSRLHVGEWLAGLAGSGRDRFLEIAAERIERGALTVTLPDGSVHRYAGKEPGPEAELEVNSWRTVRRVLFGGSLGFAQSYIDGDCDSSNLPKLLELASVNRGTMNAALGGSGVVRAFNRLLHGRNANTRDGSRRNIAFHYDLGNAFYRPWLDPSMTYSSAIFEGGENSLEAAQARKYRRLLDLMEVKAGDHVLEIGCGWGGFAEIAARERGARVTGITLSTEQLNFARQRIAAAGLADQVQFELIDYRDVTGRFDHVASIEMFEAVGERYWNAFFGKVREVLKPGGRAGLQIITIDEALFPAYRRGVDFIQAYIFPGGMLPSIKALRDEVTRVGLSWDQATGFADSYARTLAEWRTRFNQAFGQGRLPAGFDETFRRIWNYYLAYCEGGFRGGSIDVVQLALARP